MHKLNRKIVWLLSLMVFLWATASAQTALANTLISANYDALTGGRVTITLSFSQPVKFTPQGFVTQSPPRIVLDLKGVSNQLEPPQQTIGLGMAQTLTAVEGNGRTRVIIDLKKAVNYQTRVKGSKLYIDLAGSAQKSAVQTSRQRSLPVTHRVAGIDFRKGKDDAGRIVVNLADENTTVNLEQQGEKLIATFIATGVPSRLERRLDVTDFGTPVQSIATTSQGSDVRMVIGAKGDFDHVAYQLGKQFIVEVKPVSAADVAKKNEAPRYSGKRITLNFQDINVRAALQLIAEFTGLNIVVSDAVQGNITLRLRDVPWDQALDIILTTQGLDKRQIGNVILVAPAQEIATREKAELENQQKIEEFSPLHNELIQVNYAKASDMAKLLQDKDNALLGPRGALSVDDRTNTLWVQDTSDKLTEIREFVHRLDIPVKQVLIEARIVNVDKSLEQTLGIQWGITNPKHVSGTLTGANSLAGGTAASAIPVADRLNLNLPAASINGATPASFGMALAKISDNVMLDLEISALEVENRAKVISSPRLMTSNQQAAFIEAGEELPFEESTSSGATSVTFKKAVLGLRVTPQITPDNRMILDIKVNEDSVGAVVLNNGQTSIDTRQIQTKVLVDNGQTIVLGGIYKKTQNNTVNRVPFLGELPVVGSLFRNKHITNKNEELLIFITPKIIESDMSVG